MCSISWLEQSSGFYVIFSRDEQRSRDTAVSPEIFRDDVDVIMPIDPQGQGSWISVNQHGIVLALLNNYQAPVNNLTKTELIKQSAFTSRGILLKKLSKVNQWIGLEERLIDMQLNDFQPFYLCYISKQEKYLLCWNGENLKVCPMPDFFTSSSVSSEEVCQYRRALFLRETPQNQQQLEMFHSTHHQQKGMMSICLHRQDAKTVSLSSIKVTADDVQFKYWDGSPCQVKPERRIKSINISKTKSLLKNNVVRSKIYHA